MTGYEIAKESRNYSRVCLPWITNSMMTSWNGNIFRVTGLLCGKFTGEFPPQRPVTRSFDVFFDLRLNQQLSKQWRRREFETPSRPLWRHWNDCECDPGSTIVATATATAMSTASQRGSLVPWDLRGLINISRAYVWITSIRRESNPITLINSLQSSVFMTMEIVLHTRWIPPGSYHIYVTRHSIITMASHECHRISNHR